MIMATLIIRLEFNSLNILISGLEKSAKSIKDTNYR